MQALLIVSLLVGALTLYVSGRIARRFKLNDAFGFGIGLSLMALTIALAPNQWRDGMTSSIASDQILSFARDIGLTGLLFLAGARFNFEKGGKAQRESWFFVAAGGLFFVALSVVLTTLSNLTLYASVITSAAIAAASVWMTSQVAISNEQLRANAETNAGFAAAVVTGLLMLVVHFFAVFSAIPKGSLSLSAYAIVGGYELVKVVVFFGFVWFASTRFIERAKEHVSSYRLLIGYLLIAALIFVLANLVIGKMGALAWSFVAGALFVRVGAGENFRKRNAPIAAAVFMALAFLPTFLQSHGRTVTNAPLLLLVVVGLMIGKFALHFIAAKLGRASTEDTKRFAAWTLSSGEGAVMFLGFGMTRWAIEGFEYFAVLSFALVSMIAVPLLRRSSAQTLDESESGIEKPKRDFVSDKSLPSKPKRKLINKKKLHLAALFISVALFALASPALAQSQSTSSDDDPVARAMKRIDAAVNYRVESADKALADSKLINQSVATDKSEKRNALNPEIIQPGVSVSTVEVIKIPVSRTKIAKLNEYRGTLGRILEEEKVPVGLLGVALVESGFNPLALSPKGARGIWQFMPATAIRYGLPISPEADHRTHPEHSTRAAARYLRDLYNQFGDWKLALAAYNAGEGKIQRIIDKTGIRDFDEMARRRLLPLETRNYVPAVLASWAKLGGMEEVKAQRGNADKGVGQKRNGAPIVQALTRLNIEAPEQE